MTLVATALLVVCTGLVWSMLSAQRERRMRAIADRGGVPEAVVVPRRERAADPARARTCLGAAVLLASAAGALATPFRREAHNEPATFDVLDAITDVRHALELLRDAALRRIVERERG